MIYFLSLTSNYWQCQSMKKTGIFFSPMKWDRFQSAITCAHTSSLWKCSIQVKSGQIIPFWLLQLLCCCQKSSRHLLWILSSVHLSLLLHRSGSTQGSWVQPVTNMPPWCYEWSPSHRIAKMRSVPAQCAAYLGKWYC